MAYKRKADCTYEFWKRNPGDRVWHVREMFEGEQTLGPRLISFDKEKIYNLYGDYPCNMTPEEVEILDKDAPGTVAFFKARYERGKKAAEAKRRRAAMKEKEGSKDGGTGKKILLWKSFIMDAREQMCWSDEKMSLDAAPYLGELPEGVTRTVDGRRSIYECNGAKYVFRPQAEEPLFLYPVSPGKREFIPVKVVGPLRWEPEFDEGPFFDGPFEEVINYGDIKSMEAQRARRIAQMEDEDEDEEYEYSPHPCPVCGIHIFHDENSHYICPVCGWIDDGVYEDDPDYKGGESAQSLNEARAEWQEKLKDKAFREKLEKRRPHICPGCGKHIFHDYNTKEDCPICGWDNLRN